MTQAFLLPSRALGLRGTYLDAETTAGSSKFALGTTHTYLMLLQRQLIFAEEQIM
jgi:hypothetical protein